VTREEYERKEALKVLIGISQSLRTIAASLNVICNLLEKDIEKIKETH